MNYPKEVRQYIQNMMALTCSETWREAYMEHRDKQSPRRKAYALYCKTRAVVTYDRILNGEWDKAEGI